MSNTEHYKLDATEQDDANRLRRMADWLCAGRADYRAHQRKKTSTRYLKKRALCQWLWIVVGAIMALQPSVQFVILAGLFATFLSFALLDET